MTIFRHPTVAEDLPGVPLADLKSSSREVCEETWDVHISPVVTFDMGSNEKASEHLALMTQRTNKFVVDDILYGTDAKIMGGLTAYAFKHGQYINYYTIQEKRQ